MDTIAPPVPDAPPNAPPVPGERKKRILAVDDDRVLLMTLVAMLEGLGYEALQAKNGGEAYDIISGQVNDLDAVLLDREMPGMNGLELLAKLASEGRFSKLPIIMQTGADRPEQIREGIDAGVFYYLTKPVDQQVLKSVLAAAVRQVEQDRTLSSELKRHRTGFALIHECRFQLRTLAEAEHLACFLASCFPDPDRIISGLAELIINAVEHGNLEISYDEKTALIEHGTWRDEILRRADLAEFSARKIDVLFRRVDDGMEVQITDDGNGFDWRPFLQIDPSRASDNHGRGIAQANSVCFDRLTFNAVGNQVTGFVRAEPELDW